MINLLKMGYSWYSDQTVLSYAPREVAIEPTNLCNYRCSFCPQSLESHHDIPSGFMKLEDLDNILEKVVAAKACWQGRIAFTHDGEPMLHPEFPEFVRRANLKGLRPRFSSNGSKLTPEKADILEKCGYFNAAIDFSGDEDVFEQHRGRTGDWKRIRQHLAYLIEMSNRNPKVGVEIFEMGTYAKPEESRRLLEKLKSLLPEPTSNRVEFNVRVFHNAAGTSPKTADGCQEHGHEQSVAEVDREGKRVKLNIVGQASPAGEATTAVMEAPEEHHEPTDHAGKRYRKCPYPWSSLNIAWNGDVHACCRDLEGRTKLGNILEVSSLWDIWNGEKFQHMRSCISNRKPEALDACAGCDLPWDGDPAKWKLKSILRYLRKR